MVMDEGGGIMGGGTKVGGRTKSLGESGVPPASWHSH